MNDKIHHVFDKFKYLGSDLQKNASVHQEIASRIQKVISSFHKLYQRVWEEEKKKSQALI